MPQLDPSQTAGRTFLAFSLGTTIDQARAAFVARYGCEPTLIGTSLGNVLVGPIPGADQ